MKKTILFITLFLLMGGVGQAGEITGATLTGVTVSPSSLPAWSWPLETSLEPTTGAISGTETHAGTNRTRVNPNTALIETIGANLPRFEEVGGYRAVLIEPAGTNLLTYSHEFDNAAWGKTRASISANAVIGPDGTLSADKLVEAVDVGQDHFTLDSIAGASFTDDASVTFSIYLKQAERTWAKLSMLSKGNNWVTTSFNLATGAVGTDGSDSSGISSAANGFYRCSVTNDIESGGATPLFVVYIAEADNDSNYNGDGTSGIYLADAQIEQSPIPTSLIVTPGAEVLDDPGLTDAGEWTDGDANVTQNAGVGTVAWDGAGDGNFISADSPFTVGEIYQIKIVVDSMSAGALRLNENTGAFQGSNTGITSAGTHTQRVTCSDDEQLKLYGNAACDAVVSEISATITTRLTESGEPSFQLPAGLFDSSGCAIVWWRPGYGYGDMSGTDHGIIATRDSVVSLFYHDTNGVMSRDGTNTSLQNPSWSANTWYKLIVKWGYLVGGVEKFRVGVDSGSGVSWGTEQTFSGSFTLGSYLRLGYGLFSRMHLRQLSLFPTVLTDSEINQRGGGSP